MAELQARQAFLISLKLIGKFPFIPFLNNPRLWAGEPPFLGYINKKTILPLLFV